MLIAENMAAVLVFALLVAAFALGYLLRRWVDAGRADWNAYAYRGKGAHDGER